MPNSTTAKENIAAPRLWLVVLLPFAAGYFLSYLFRTVNAVISPDLIRELGLSAGDLGLLTSAYFFSFALFQLPLGMLLDRYSPKRVEAGLLLIAATGALVFALSHSSGGLAIGRALIGLGVSACLMAGYTACAIWFQPAKLAAVNAIILCAGGLGALTATAPVEAALHVTDWRGLFLVLAALSVVAAGLIFFIVPERQRSIHHVTWREQWQGTVGIFRSGEFWRVAPAATITQASFMAIQGLWAGPWLRNVAGLTRDAAATYLFWTAAAMFAGQLTWGLMAARLAQRGVASLTLLKIGLGTFMLVEACLVAGWNSLPLWIMFGFFGVASTLCYPIVAQRFPAALAGRANTAVNLLVFAFAFTIQWLIGVIINVWPAPHGGYLPIGYGAAFGAALLAQGVAVAWLLLQKTAIQPGHA